MSAATARRVGIIDYRSGNIASVWNAVSFITDRVAMVRKPAEMEACSHLILPGVGAFAAAMQKLRDLGLRDELLVQLRERKKQFLGICVGMQVLATTGKEFEECAGLNVIDGAVERIDVDRKVYSLPHIGWNNLEGPLASPLFAGLEDDPVFYFLHSYHFICKDPEVDCAFAEYGMPFVAAVSRQNVHGVQFHPEKSQNNGIRLLSNFLSLSC